MTSTKDLAGRVALVTGASSGIGAEIALSLARRGADVMINAVADKAGLVAIVARIAQEGVGAHGHLADLAEADGVAAAAEALLAWRPQGVDILVLNAAVQSRSAIEELDLAAADWQWRVNLRSGMDLIRRFAPAMRTRQWGRIVTIGSVQQFKPHPHMPVYAALKSGQVNLVRSLATQFAADGVTVNNVAPGVIATKRNAAVLDDLAYRQRVLEKIPAARFGEAGEVAEAVSFLCSPAAAYITGADLPVDGGMGL